MARVRASRVGRPPKKKEAPIKRKFSFGDIVTFHVDEIIKNKSNRLGKVIEFSKKDPKNYIVRDVNTWVVYVVNEDDMSLATSSPKEKEDKEDSVSVPLEKQIDTVDNVAADKGVEIVSTMAADNGNCILEIDAKDVMNHDTGQAVTSDISELKHRISKIEKKNKEERKRRLIQYYTKLGLISALL